MRKLIYKALRLFLAFKAFSFMTDMLSPYIKDNRIVFPKDSQLRVKVAWLTLAAFVVLISTVILSISFLAAAIKLVRDRIRPTNG